MADESDDGDAVTSLTDSAERIMAALLAIDPAAAERVRSRSPSRRRPRTQFGPELDLGDDGSASAELETS